jgi:16S rRNA U516 pseudouridylate synthase RsuA-like enzyme
MRGIPMTTSTAHTVRDRLIQSGIAESRALEHIHGGWVLVDGRVVTDPDAQAELPAHVELKMIIRR